MICILYAFAHAGRKGSKCEENVKAAPVMRAAEGICAYSNGYTRFHCARRLSQISMMRMDSLWGICGHSIAP